jgi:hypothetical protein
MGHAERDKHKAVLVAIGCDAPALDYQAAALTVVAGHDAEQGADVAVTAIPATGSEMHTHADTRRHTQTRQQSPNT